MPFKIDWKNRHAEVTFYGQITIAEVLEANAVFYGHADFDDLTSQIWSFLEADCSLVSFSDVDVPAARDAVASIYKKRLITALVANEGYARQLCEKYREMLQVLGSTWEVAIFEKLQQARHWCEKTLAEKVD